MLALFAVLVAIAHTKLLSRWPSVATAVALELAGDLAMTWYLSHQKTWWLQHPHRYLEYFSIYWGAAAIQALLRIWIMADVARSFEGLDFLPMWVHQAIIGVGSLAAVMSAAYCFYSNPHAPPTGVHMLAAFAVLIDRTVNLGFIALVAGVLFCVKVFGFGWHAVGASIANGLLLRVASKACFAEILATKSRTGHLIATALDSSCNVAVLIFWVCIFEKYRTGGGISRDDTLPPGPYQRTTDEQRTVHP